jgi:cell division initiation protein
MMKISPIDIQQQQFKTRPFGYEKTGVDRFLELLAEELERLVRENLDLMEELARVKASLKELRDREETLKETLVTTQKLTGELKSKARRDIDTMMAEAEVKAERLMHNAEARRLELIKEVQEIKRQKIDFEVSLRGLLEKHIRMLDLDAVEIARGDAEAGLLEEPLPFTGHHEQESAAQQPPADQQKSSAASQELDLEFDPGDEGDDEDGPK